jgi:recombinational DNA repair protein RecR
LGFATFRLNGQGEHAEDYVAMLRLSDLVELLLAAGYDKRKDEVKDSDIRRCNQCGEWTINDPCNFCEDQ